MYSLGQEFNEGGLVFGILITFIFIVLIVQTSGKWLDNHRIDTCSGFHTTYGPCGTKTQHPKPSFKNDLRDLKW